MDWKTMLWYMRKNLECGVGPAKLTAEVLDQLDRLHDYGEELSNAILIALESDDRGPMPMVKQRALDCIDETIAQAQAFRGVIEALPVIDLSPREPVPPPVDPVKALPEILHGIQVALEKIASK